MDDIKREVRLLADQIKGKEFDWYISMGRGGMIPTCLLAEITGQKKIDFLSIYSYEGASQGNLTYHLKDLVHLSRQRVLLIDDLVDTGTQMSFCKKMLEALDIQVETAVLIVKGGSKFCPDYFVKEAPADEWVVFKWEV